jgi:hypothetical protein
MTYQIERDQFIAQFARTFPQTPITVAAAFLRLSTTLHRLAEAQCNGDWPCVRTLQSTARTDCRGEGVPRLPCGRTGASTGRASHSDSQDPHARRSARMRPMALSR